MNFPHLRTAKAAAIVVGGSVVATVVAAFLVPIGMSDGNSTADRLAGLRDVPAVVPEDLTDFVASDRWGISLEHVLAEADEAEAQGSGLNPALKALGYVGLVVEEEARTVLLTTIEGAVARLEPGDTLPDGRVLADVRGNSIALRAANGGDEKAGDVEVMELFPRPMPGDGTE